jgi:hypothetical protein
MAAVRRLATSLFLSFSMSCMAAPFAVQVGEARIGLDAPPGFAETGSTGSPRLQELGEALTSASNRILLFAISDADMRRFMTGDQLDLRRYMIVVTPRGMERERMSDSAFRAYVLDASKGLGEAPQITDPRQYLGGQPSGAVTLLAELKKEPDAASLLMGVRTQGSGFFATSKFQLSSITLLLMRGKPFSVQVYTQYEDPADLEWIRATTLRWVDELRRLNSR